MHGSSSATSKPAVRGAALVALWAIALLTLSALDANAQSVAQRTPTLANARESAR